MTSSVRSTAAKSRRQWSSPGRWAPTGSLRVALGASLLALMGAGVACSSDPSPNSETGTATGGDMGSGGGPGSGGLVGVGGVPTGGITSTGGTGGVRATGGASTTGGTPATGGTSAAGGTPPTGGTPATGGALPTGGATTTGGTASGGMGPIAGMGNDGGHGGSDESTGGNAGFMPCPTTGACNVMPLGDSITEDCCTPPMGGYRIELYHQALVNQKNMTFVGTQTNGPGTVDGQQFPNHHEGYGGRKIDQIASIVRDDGVIRTTNPHIILLKIGTNDINGNDDIANAPNRLKNLVELITSEAPDALLVVSAIIPTTNDGTNQRVEAYNAAIQVEAEAAATAGKHVVFIDNYAVFEQNSNYKSDYMADGLHPNTEGYAVLGRSFFDLISPLLPTAQ